MDYQGRLKMKQRAYGGGPSQVRQPWVPSVPDTKGGSYVTYDVYESQMQPWYDPYVYPTNGGGYFSHISFEIQRQPWYAPYMYLTMDGRYVTNDLYGNQRQLWVPSGGGYVRDNFYANQWVPSCGGYVRDNVSGIQRQLQVPSIPATEVGGSFRDDVYDNHRELFEEYYRQLKESEGFDVDPELFSQLPQHTLLTSHRPLNIHKYIETYERVVMLAKAAIDDYNTEHGTAYQFVDVEKANSYVASGCVYYITFQVKNLEAGDCNTPEETFQARVWDQPWVKKIKVLLFRPKPIKPQN